jgi:murein peptide amidase A
LGCVGHTVFHRLWVFGAALVAAGLIAFAAPKSQAAAASSSAAPRASDPVATLHPSASASAETNFEHQSLAEQCALLSRSLKLSSKPFCTTLGSGQRLGVSMQRRNIFAVHSPRDIGVSTVGTASARNIKVLVLGAIHGDELSAGWLALQWLALKPPHIDGADFSVLHVPLLNPDGLFHAKPSRTNGSGVDLNRNFPTPNWHVESNKWWVNTTKRDKRRWPGKTPGSEIETQHVISLIKSFKPSVIVSIHAPLGILDYDGAGMPPERIGSIWLDSVGIYPGSLGHYSSRTHGIPVLTVELPAALKVVSDTEALRMWHDLFAWVKRYAQHDAATK